MAKRVCHFEIHADDLERCADFYQKIFDWDIKKWDAGAMQYMMVMTGGREEAGGINGGIVKRAGSTPPPGTGMHGYCCTIDVPNYDEFAAKILANGGQEAMPKFAIPGMAWQGYFIDTEGNCFGLHQPDETAK